MDAGSGMGKNQDPDFYHFSHSSILMSDLLVVTGEVGSKGGRIHRASQPIQVAENFLAKLGHFHYANIEIYTWTSSQNLYILFYSFK
jgi:hypothetical protein